MAFSKKQKSVMLAQYEEWLKKSQAIFVLDYKRMTMKDIDTLRARVREAGGEFHVTKNTLMARAMEGQGYKDHALLDGATVVGFAFNDPPAIAKVFSEATAKSEIFKLRGGYLGAQPLAVAQVKALADLPPLPVMRARILGLLQAPAAQLARTVAEPARSLAAVVRAYGEKENAPAEAAA